MSERRHHPASAEAPTTRNAATRNANPLPPRSRVYPGEVAYGHDCHYLRGSLEPVLSTTPTSVAIRELVFRTEALESAVREIALVVGEIALEVQKLAARKL